MHRIWMYRRLIWVDTQGRRNTTYVPLWRTRRYVSAGPNFKSWFRYEDGTKPRVWRWRVKSG